MKSIDILKNAMAHQQERAQRYDAPQGERSIRRTVLMFNTLTGHKLSDVDGWQFMEILKMVRTRQGEFRADNFEDAAAYASLAGEAAYEEAAERQSMKQAFEEMVNEEDTANVHDKPSRKTTANGRKKAVQKTKAKRRTR